MRRFFAIIVLLFAVLLGGCGVAITGKVTGTVDRINHYTGKLSLEGDSTVYSCRAKGCSLIREGDHVEMLVGVLTQTEEKDMIAEITRIP